MDETRERLLQVARTIGKARGFRVAAKDVAVEAGVAEASLFRRFSRRIDLLDALLVEMLEDADHRLLAIAKDTGTSAEAKIRAINDIGFEHVGRYGKLAAEVTAGDLPQGLSRHLPMIHRLWRLMGRVIKEGIEQGEFRETNARMFVVAWRALISPQAVAAYWREGDVATPEEMSEIVSEFLISALRRN